MPISDSDIQDVFQAVESLDDDGLRELASRLDKVPSPAARHLSSFVLAHVKKSKPSRRNHFAGTTAQTQQIFDQSKENAR